ncbi:MAG TPA: cytochrome P450 [Gemmatimonadales bacterium]|nr:cytochrome P450 [Gemmatimonadales bacterium]
MNRRPIHPPGPKGHLLAGTFAAWRPDPLRYMEQLVGLHGPAVRFHYVLGRYGYLFAHPDHYRRILLDNYRNYTKRHPIYDVLRVALGDGLVTLDGARWVTHRRLIQPAFHRSAVRSAADLIVQRTQSMLAAWDRDARAGGTGHVRAVDRDMMALTLGVVGEALFGLSMDTHISAIDADFSAFSRDLMAIATNPLALYFGVRLRLTPSARRLHAAAGRLRQVVGQIVAARREGPERETHDLLGLLLAAREAETDRRLTDVEVRDEVMTIMLAGHETSATALTWTLYLLGTHREAEGAVHDELERVLGGAPPSVEALPRLPLTRAVAEEAMRLYPPIYAFDRRAVGPDTVGGYDLPAGASVSLCPYVTHRLPEFWERPDEFRPERFVEGRPHEFTYLPFAAGPRGCIGEGFAMTEIVLVLAAVLQRYRLRPAPGLVVEPTPLITLRPRYGLTMVAEARGP